ncbi:MAG: hypothetical protein [Bacteriophage sp.]|nr:MAG: hypothetical protein [Bacteriophage sp.]
MDCIDHGRIKDVHARGYARLWIREERPDKQSKWRKVQLHRLVLAESLGIPLDELGTDVCRHTCDNPRCINPAHLVRGSHVENMQDMVERGRARSKRGADSPHAKLSGKAVAFIRSRHIPRHKEYSAAALGRMFGVTKQTILSVVNGDSWRVPDV